MRTAIFQLLIFIALCQLAVAANAVIPDDLSYKIINSDRVPGIKCSLDVRLNRKVSADVLRAVALKLRAQESGTYERMFITYLLPGMTPGAGAWATSHFTPELEVKILGLTVEEEATAVAADAKKGGEIIGRWVADAAVGYVVTIRRDGDRLLFERKFKDGSSGSFELVETREGGKRRFANKKGSSFGEYYVVNSDGNLATYDKDGYIDTMRALP